MKTWEAKIISDRIMNFVEEDLEQKKCLFCDSEELQDSHVIKKETLLSMAGGKRLLTLSSRDMSAYSPLIEDRHEFGAKKAFVFRLLCNDCDKFVYENKAKVKKLYDGEDLRSIALKIRLKELYDNMERVSVWNYKGESLAELSLKASVGFKPQVAASVFDEEKEINAIRAGEKSYKTIADCFIDFRVPFAMESFIAPTKFPISKKSISINKASGRKSSSYMSVFYVILQPGSGSSEWSRLTVFIEENDSIMDAWFSELFKKHPQNSESIANLMISFHINEIAKNFIMSQSINRDFLTKVRKARLRPRMFGPVFSDWMSLIRD